MSTYITSLLLFIVLVGLYAHHSYIHGKIRFMPLIFFGINGVLYIPILLLFREHMYTLLIYFFSVYILVHFFFIYFQKKHIIEAQSSELYRAQIVKTYTKSIKKFYKETPPDIPIILMRLYNESEQVKSCLLDLIKNGHTHIIVLDDGSTDTSVEIVKEIQKKYTSMLLIQHPTCQGGGSANKTLFYIVSTFDTSKGNRWYITFDSDGQMRAKDIKNFFQYEKKYPNTDIFIGSRFLQDGHANNITWIRKIILIGSRFVTFIFSRIWLTDPHNGFRMIRKQALSKLNIQADDMYYASELIHSVQKKNMTYKEVPVEINYSSYSYQKGQKNRNAIKIFTHLVHEHIFSK